MKSPILILIVSVSLAIAACSNRSPEEVKIPDATATLDGVRFTEATLMGELVDVRLSLKSAVDASKGLPSEPAVRAAAAGVEASLKTIEQTIAEHPAADVEKLVAEFMTAIDQLKKIITVRDAEILKLKDADARFWNRVLVGLGIALSLAAGAATAVGFYAITIPFIGAALGRHLAALLGVGAGVCFLLAYLAAWTREHPVWTAAIVVGVVGAAVGMAYVNLINDRRERAAT